jgi:hypothetical protein
MRRPTIRFLGHYVEMVVAMSVGMGLALPWRLIWPGLRDHPIPDTLVMLAAMTIGMAAWMAIRRHSRAMILEMTAAMVAPFVILLAPLAAGAITAHTVATAGHTLMFLTMLAAMLLRREHYAHHRGTAPMRNRQPARFEGAGAR